MFVYVSKQSILQKARMRHGTGDARRRAGRPTAEVATRDKRDNERWPGYARRDGGNLLADPRRERRLGMNRMPDAELAFVEETKVVNYLLARTGRGRAKADFFEAFGFASDRWEDLAQAL